MFVDQNGVSCFVDQNGVTEFIDQNGILLSCGAGTSNIPIPHVHTPHVIHKKR